MTSLQVIWFILIFVLLGGYAVLDGFDLGVGILHLLGRTDRERRISLNAIGPVWDGNEVWLLTGGGALFAAFPNVYATVFSGFYLALILLLLAFIARAVAIEVRSKVDSDRWKQTWDAVFCLSSLLPALLLGVALGNVFRGIPINAEGEYTGGFFALLNPFALLCGVLSLVAFTMHGAIYLSGKAEPEVRVRLRHLIAGLWPTWIVLFLVTVVAGHHTVPWFASKVLSSWVGWTILPLTLLALLMIRRFAARDQWARALLCSGLAIALMMATVAASLFPLLVPSTTDLGRFSLSIENSASSANTLTAMLIIALVGMPIVIGYSVFVYYVFRGKVRLSQDSY